jgi:hypothetical protein
MVKKKHVIKQLQIQSKDSACVDAIYTIPMITQKEGIKPNYFHCGP